jgi:hypothetical protein
MQRSGVALVQEHGEIMALLGAIPHRRLEQRFLYVARHIAPNRHRRLAQQ